MATIKSRAIVFRTLKYSESSVILDLFTEEKGLRSFIVGGVRKARGKAAYFQHLNLLEIVAGDRSDGKLARITEYSLGHSYRSLTTSIIKSNIGIFIVEVCRNAIKESETNVALFEFIWKSLVHIDECDEKQLTYFPITFLLQLCDYLGVFPLDNYSEDRLPYFDLSAGRFTLELERRHVLHIDESLLIHHALRQILDNEPWSLTRSQRNDLLDCLIRYYQEQIPGFKALKSLDIIRSII